MTDHAVVIAGGSLTGMMLAAELTLAGIDVAIVERRATPDLAGSRGGGLHARTIEVLDQRGIADRFLSRGQVAQAAGFSMIRLDISDFPTRHPYGLALWQNRFERILADWVGELAVPVYRGREVTGFTQDDTGVSIDVSGGPSARARPLRAAYLVGCDGRRSLIRKTAGIEFAGWDPSVSSLVAEVELSEEPEPGIRRDDKGTSGMGRLEDGKRVRVVGAAGRRRGARPCPGGRAGSQHRPAGCGEPGLEAGPGGQENLAREPAGYLPGRAAPGRGPRLAQHHGAAGAAQPR
jgi:3-(3-hydroxy-phenyl)propionate hydroxylase